MDSDLYLTVEGLEFLQIEDIDRMYRLRYQDYSDAPLCDLLEILALERAIGRRNAKIDRLEAVSNDLPF